MSRKQRKRQNRKGFVWPLLVFGGVLLLAAAFLFANRSAAGAGDGGGGTGGAPKIAADPLKIDYGYVKFGNDKTFKIKVTNSGTGILRFKDKPYVEVVEGC